MEEGKRHCEWCDEILSNHEDAMCDGHLLCKECANVYDNSTGYCGLSCCMTGECDESC